jgi:hypothetical protein
MKSKLKLLYFFCWGLGVVGMAIIANSIFLGNQSIFLSDFKNPLIKYSLLICAINLFILLFLAPILMHRGIITLDYYNDDKYNRAKSNIVLLGISLPGWSFLSIAAYNLSSSRGLIYLFDGFLLMVLFSSAIKLLRRNS